MSTEQHEVAPSNAPHGPQGSKGSTPVDITQQVTTPTPTTFPSSSSTKPPKNPKRVAAGKLVAERTRLAREKQKIYLAEANIIIANHKEANKANKAKKSRGKITTYP